MPAPKRKIPSAKLRSAAFKRVRADHQGELAADYVEMIADLIDERGEARCTDIALRLGVANATVVKTLRRLQTAGLVEQQPYRSIFLTMEGWKQAEDGRRRHAVVEKVSRGPRRYARCGPPPTRRASNTMSAMRRCGRWQGSSRGVEPPQSFGQLPQQVGGA